MEMIIGKNAENGKFYSTFIMSPEERQKLIDKGIVEAKNATQAEGGNFEMNIKHNEVGHQTINAIKDYVNQGVMD